MTDEVNPLAAKKMRQAMKVVKDDDEKPEYVLGDVCEIRSFSGAKHQRTLVIFKDGHAVAGVPIANSTFKRLKRQWIAWNDVQSGLITGYRQHGNEGRGW